MKPRMLITGVAGFIGREAWQRFSGRYELFGVDNLMRDGSRMPTEGGTCYLADVENMDGFEDVDVIIHLAAQVSVTGSVHKPYADLITNAAGTLRMCQVAQRTGAKLIFASTNKVFGELQGQSEPVYDDQPWHPQTPYGISKAAAAMYVRDLLPSLGYVLHQSCVWSESQRGSIDQGWIGWLRRTIKAGKPVTCFGDGSQVRDLLHVSDLLDVYEMAIDGKINPGSYVTGGGEESAATFSEVVELLGGKIDKYEDWRPHDQRYFVSANEELTRAGWAPKRMFTGSEVVA